MNFGVVVFNQAEELDFVGPWELLTMWSRWGGGPKNCLIVAETMAPVICANGLSINPHVDFAGCPVLDYLLVPGGQAQFNAEYYPAAARYGGFEMHAQAPAYVKERP